MARSEVECRRISSVGPSSMSCHEVVTGSRCADIDAARGNKCFLYPSIWSSLKLVRITCGVRQSLLIKISGDKLLDFDSNDWRDC